MKHIKAFEQTDDSFRDYWIALKNKINTFNNIFYTDVPYQIKYYIKSTSATIKISDYNNDQIWIKESEIEFISKTKEEVDAYIQSKKYNL